MEKHLLSETLYHKMTTAAMAMTEQEPSRGRKFSILENVLPFRDSFLLGRACPKPCWKRVRQAESSSSSDSNPFLGAISRFQKQTVQGLGKPAVIAL